MGRVEFHPKCDVRARVAYARTERVLVSAERPNLPLSIIPISDIEGRGGPAGAGRNARSRRRRQLVRLADVVGFSNIDFRSDLVDSAKVRNVERMLQVRLSRRRGGLAAKRAVDLVGAVFALVLLLPLLALRRWRSS